MRGSWPKVQASVTTTFTATHSLPLIGVAEPHEHEYRVTAGWTHEINPQNGCTDTVQSMRADMEKVVAHLRGAYLNDVLPVPPTAEMLALWILAQLSAAWGFVQVEAYGDFMVRAEGDTSRARWADILRRPAQRPANVRDGSCPMLEEYGHVCATCNCSVGWDSIERSRG